MKISEILKNGFSISFEFFPPKSEEGEKDLFANLKRLEEIRPSFVSVTYGAGGGTRDKTRKIVTDIADMEHWNVMAHLTCVGHTKNEIRSILEDYRKAGIDNILALRGDSPAGTDIKPENSELPHAKDLVRLIKEEYDGFFSIGGAVFPEKHPESPDWNHEILYLKMKTETGMEFGITQLFFENRFYFDLADRCIKAGISIPPIPGIMPITNFKQIQRFAAMCGATIPSSLTDKLSGLEEKPEEVAKIGIDFAVKQCEDLLRQGVPGLHFYTLNKSSATLEIYHALGIAR